MRCLLLTLSLFLSFPILPSFAKVFPVDFNSGRNQLIAYILSHQLPAQHFAHVPFDDALSQEAYDIYIRQLDPRKRFLLQSDVNQLGAFSKHIDDELKRGRIVLADAGAELLNDRIKTVQAFIDALIKQGFDFTKEDYLEADPKKIKYVTSIDELKSRWHKSMKMQILDSYLTALDTAEKKGTKAEDFNKLISEATEKVQKRVHRVLDRLLQQTRQDHYNRYFGSVARAFDPHTNYMPPTSKEDFDIHMSGSLEGIGALLREDDGLIKVVRIIPGSAAEKQGELQAEDTIFAVSERDGEPVEISDMRIREAVSYIRGPKDTEVLLTVLKADGKRMVIPIVRDVVQIEETYVKSTILKTKNNTSIGYVRIPSFYRDFSASANGKKGRNATDDTRIEVEKLMEENIHGMILDLRSNGGGALSDAVLISGLFLPGGPVVQVKDHQGMIRVLEDEDVGTTYQGPLIVLVDQFSASASEILAAAFQDYGRALIIGGKHTHGKGTVQALLDMNRNLPLLQLKKYEDLGALKLTIQKFYRITGDSTQFKGVEPDIQAPSVFEFLESGEKYLDNALPWDQVENVGFEPWAGKKFEHNDALARSLKWIDDSEKFKEIKSKGQKAKIRKDDTKIAISLASMKKERQELKSEKDNDPFLEDSDKKEDKKDLPLAEQLVDDPFVNLSLYLFGDIAITSNSQD